MAALGDQAGPSQANDWSLFLWPGGAGLPAGPGIPVGDASALRVRQSRPDPSGSSVSPTLLSSLDEEGPKGAEWGQRA